MVNGTQSSAARGPLVAQGPIASITLSTRPPSGKWRGTSHRHAGAEKHAVRIAMPGLQPHSAELEAELAEPRTRASAARPSRKRAAAHVQI